MMEEHTINEPVFKKKKSDSDSTSITAKCTGQRNIQATTQTGQLAKLRLSVAQQNKLMVLYREKKKEKETEGRLLDR